MPTERSVLFVHAHPDDETIATGATMAAYAARGARVTLVTCTLGEEGEIVVAELAHLAAGRDDRLGELRIRELTDACAALGVRDQRFLGGAGRWRDSGMAGTPANENPRAFARAALDEPVAELVRVIREVRPQVVVTYDENGAYGHPDHIRAHQVTVAAFDAAAQPDRGPAGPAWRPSKLYYTALPVSVLQAGIDALRAAGHDLPFEGVDRAEDLGFAVPDRAVTTEVDAAAQLPAKLAAMRAHRSQISVDGPFFALADNIGQQALGREYYVLARGRLGPTGPGGRESDLFAGLP